MTKKFTALAVATSIGLVLASCGEAEDAADGETEAAESSEAAEEAEHVEYFTDETGEFSQEVGEEAVANINERLATKHEEGSHIHIRIVESLNGEDSDAAAQAALSESDAEAIIFIAVGEQEVAVVGRNIDQREGEGAANAITAAFDNGNFENGLMNGIMATEMHMED